MQFSQLPALVKWFVFFLVLPTSWEPCTKRFTPRTVAKNLSTKEGTKETRMGPKSTSREKTALFQPPSTVVATKTLTLLGLKTTLGHTKPAGANKNPGRKRHHRFKKNSFAGRNHTEPTILMCSARLPRSFEARTQTHAITCAESATCEAYWIHWWDRTAFYKQLQACENSVCRETRQTKSLPVDLT